MSKERLHGGFFACPFFFIIAAVEQKNRGIEKNLFKIEEKDIDLEKNFLGTEVKKPWQGEK